MPGVVGITLKIGSELFCLHCWYTMERRGTSPWRQRMRRGWRDARVELAKVVIVVNCSKKWGVWQRGEEESACRVDWVGTGVRSGVCKSEKESLQDRSKISYIVRFRGNAITGGLEVAEMKTR